MKIGLKNIFNKVNYLHLKKLIVFIYIYISQNIKKRVPLVSNFTKLCHFGTFNFFYKVVKNEVFSSSAY